MAGRHHDADGNGIADFAEQNPYGGAPPTRRAAAAPSGLTGSLIRAALASVGAVGKQIVSMDELAAGASDALRQAPDLTPAGAAGFLATCAVESAWWRTTTEYGKAGSLRYDPYRGRTFIQLTWESNYLGFGQWLAARGLASDPQVFVKSPAALSDIRWAWLGATYYMSTHGLWPYANRGQFRELSQAVNGGNGRIGTSFTPNGWAERQKAYAVFLAAGTALLPASAPPPAPSPQAVGTDLVDNIVLTGTGDDTIGIDPPGSRVIGEAYFSLLMVKGPKGVEGTVKLFPQKPGGGTGPVVTLRSRVRDDSSNTSDRDYTRIPDGTDQIDYQWSIPAGCKALLIPAFRAAP